MGRRSKPWWQNLVEISGDSVQLCGNAIIDHCIRHSQRRSSCNLSSFPRPSTALMTPHYCSLLQCKKHGVRTGQLMLKSLHIHLLVFEARTLRLHRDSIVMTLTRFYRSAYKVLEGCIFSQDLGREHPRWWSERSPGTCSNAHHDFVSISVPLG